jgi:hypothetical protein
MESENVYGHELPQSVRELLSLATLFLTLYLPVEKSAPRLDERAAKKPNVVQQLKELMTRAQLFSSHYWAEEYRPDGPPMTLDSRLQAELAAICDVDEDSVVNDLSLLRFSLGATVGSCDNILKKLRSDEFGYKDGETWNIWIALVTLILKFHDLPFRTRKDVARHVTQPGGRFVWHRACRPSPTVDRMVQCEHKAARSHTPLTHR